MGNLLFIVLLLTTSTSLANPKWDVWKHSPKGANVFSEISSDDLLVAKTSGIRLIRLGAVGQHQDFRWLISNDRFDLSKKNQKRLKDMVRRSHDLGFKIVISLSELPGRRWRFEKKDYRIWESEAFQDDFVAGWRGIASLLKSEAAIVGYDLINEPYLKDGQNSKVLNDLYRRTIRAIREVDAFTPIIVQPSKMGSLDALPELSIFTDDFVIYSFHYYDPWVYFSKRKNQGKLIYPGPMPRWISDKAQGPSDRWNLEMHRKRLGLVKLWAAKHGLQPFQIFVGELGVWKDAKGADKYLQDVLTVISEENWSWTYYAFREQGWENADAEKGPTDPSSQRSILFEIVRSYLK